MNGQVVSPVEANSSPSHFIASKGSSVRLHWNYAYVGDGSSGGVTRTFKEQLIRVNSTSPQSFETLAKRNGQNGALTLESPVPAPFTGRVEVIPSNSTSVFHNLQYNDSTYEFLSTVNVELDPGGGTVTSIFVLKPVVSITVNGMRIYNFPLFVKSLGGFHNVFLH